MTANSVVYLLLCLFVGLFALNYLEPLLTPGRRWVMLVGILAAAVFIGVMSPIEQAEWMALAFTAGVLVLPLGYKAGHYIDRLRVILAERGEQNDGPTIEGHGAESTGPLSGNGRGPGDGAEESTPGWPDTVRRYGDNGPARVAGDTAPGVDPDE